MPGVPRGIAVEPSPSTAAELRTRLADYDSIDIVECAISDRSGSAKFYAEKDYGETSSLIRTHSAVSAKPLSVRVSTLDAEVAAANIASVDFLKIDAEGLDLHVLRGGEESINSGKIDVIQ